MSRRPCPRCGGFIRVLEPFVFSCMTCGWWEDTTPTPAFAPFEDDAPRGLPIPTPAARQRLPRRAARTCRICREPLPAGRRLTVHDGECRRELQRQYDRRHKEKVKASPHALPRPCAICGVLLPIGHRECSRKWAMMRALTGAR